MELTKSQTQHIAELARIKLTEKETGKTQSDLSTALKYIEVLDELDLEDIEPTAQITRLSNIYREDELKEPQTLSQSETLSNAPHQSNGYFSVPRVL
ncbi:Asp-tRNA(Asn)/Glu-tRNA(Gln) amidotransferase subunit GatC [Patescibacteria group bacterium]|nr:Asp-tRNA(Asn)/Glu-tRNA(Gln) amidotransferase subunit GatC [Patescibacteria group bacterium]